MHGSNLQLAVVSPSEQFVVSRRTNTPSRSKYPFPVKLVLTKKDEFMMARKPHEVVEFREPVYYKKTSKEESRERKKFLIGNVSDMFERTPVVVNKESRTKAESSELNLKEMLREVQSLAVSNLTCKAKRRAEEHQLKALGAKPSKSDYVPYPHYQRVMRSQKDKERKIAEELKISQRKNKRRKILVKGKGRWKSSIKSLEPGMGKFKNGVLKLSKKELTKGLH